MAKQEKVQVDEDYMKQIISQGLPVKREIPPKAETAELEEKPDIRTEEPVQQNENRHTVKKKKVITGDYKELYFQKMELPDRQPIYVSRSTHEKLIKIVTTIGERKATVSSYVETIILRHFDQFQDEINDLYRKTFENPI